MAKSDQTFQGAPSGSVVGGYTRPRVQIGFDDEMLKAITKLAEENNRSFASQVRILLAYALSRRT